MANPQDVDVVPTLVYQSARALLARHGWHLLDVSTLAAQAAELVAPVPSPAAGVVERACTQIYAQTLYTALQEPSLREVAFGELHAYLYRIARKRRPELAEDAAQEAILLIFRNFATCRDPRAFLKFAIYQLLSAFHHLQVRHEEFSLDSLPGVAGDENEQVIGVGSVESLAEEIDAREEAAKLLRWLRAVIEESPRAKNQILAVSLKYLEEWDDVEIAKALDTTVANIHVLRSRGLEKLRAEWQKRHRDAKG